MLAIGSTAASDGELWWAAAILDDACRKASGNVSLLVACGSAHEAIGALPAHALLLEGREPDSDESLALNNVSFRAAVAVRNRHLATARRSLEAALRINPADPEARLRLAHIHMAGGNADAGAPLLEDFARQRPSDRRAAFLSLLFLATIRQHAGQMDAAISLFRQAVEIVPSARSAYTALAAALLRSGRPGDAADVTARMFEAPVHPPDPWASYHYGQYWLVDALFAALRSEARQ